MSALRPKVAGSWTLHKLLPRNLSFFVLLTSVSGVAGARARANHAAANTYQNALARHRVSLGEKTISLDLGPVLSIGVAADKDLTGALAQDGFRCMTPAVVFALLEYCCDPRQNLLGSA